MSFVLDDLRRNYIVPESKVSEIESRVLKSKFASVFSPKKVFVLGIDCGLTRQTPSVDVESQTHYIQDLKMMYEDSWKIRSGLYPSVLEAYYGPLHSSHSLWLVLSSATALESRQPSV